jgi:CHAT domain-containing protein
MRTNSNLGYLKFFCGKFSEAYDYLIDAIRQIEELRASIKIPEIRKEYFETVVNTYRVMVSTCLGLENKNEEAFKYAESAKARTFFELLAAEKRRIKGPPELIERYRSILKNLDEIQTKIMRAQLRETHRKEEFQKLVSKCEKCKREHDEIREEIKKSDPEYYSIKTAEPIGLSELAQVLEGRTLIEYFFGEKLIIFVFNGELVVKTIDVSENELKDKILEFRTLVDDYARILCIEDQFGLNKKLFKATEGLLEYLYKTLVKPVKELIRGDEIIIVPHRYLHLVPFEALKGDRYLVEDYKISFAPSASSLKFLHKSTGKGALVVGNPNAGVKYGDIASTCLPFSEEEATHVAQSLGTKPIIGKAAKKDVILEKMIGKEFLHFACHGLFDPINPSLSKIILADGSITAGEFMDLEIDANVVVLSACETALAKISSGDEVEGLVRAIQLAGCRFVIASLWKVDDRSTKELFLKFYAEGGDVTDKLRNAILSMIKDAHRYSFYQWAPFQAYGI